MTEAPPSSTGVGLVPDAGEVWSSQLTIFSKTSAGATDLRGSWSIGKSPGMRAKPH